MFIPISALVGGVVFLLLLGAGSMIWVCRHVIYLNRETFERYKKSLRQKKEALVLLNDELKIKTLAIQNFVYETNHYWENPLLKRLRGLINTLAKLRKNIKENLTLIKKPTDYQYGKLALKDWEEIDETLDMLFNVALEMEAGILARATKVDKLQK